MDPVTTTSEVCLNATGMGLAIAGYVTMGASVLANMVPESNIFGKVVKYLALNFKVKKA